MQKKKKKTIVQECREMKQGEDRCSEALMHKSEMVTA